MKNLLLLVFLSWFLYVPAQNGWNKIEIKEPGPLSFGYGRAHLKTLDGKNIIVNGTFYIREE